MELKFKAGSIVGAAVNAEGHVVIGVKGFPHMVVDPTRLSEAVRAEAFRNGIRQRLMDKAAMLRNKATGESATPQEKYESIKNLFDHYMSGAESWNLERAGGGASGPRLDPIIIQAIGEAFGKTLDVVRAMVEAKATEKGIKPQEYLAGMAELARVKPIVARLRAEAASKVEVDEDPFAGMDEGGDAGDEPAPF